MSAEEFTFVDYFVIIKRRRKYFFMAFAVIFTCAIIFAMHWSNYRSTATIQIKQSEISAGMATPSGMNSNAMLEALADQRVSRLAQQVTSTASLIEVITKFDLYRGMRQTVPLADIATVMRPKVKINMIGSTVNAAAAGKETSEDLAAIAFTLGFDYSDPETAQQVMDDLVTRFLDEDLKERRAQAKETSDFLSGQISALEVSMDEQEKKIAAFHASHSESRPESLMFNQQAAANTNMNLQNIESQITANEGNQGSIRAQLATIDPYSRVIADGQVLTTPAIQLKALEAQYATLSAQYGPEHPDVVKARHQIASLRTQVGTTAKKDDNTGQLKAQIADLRTNLETSERTQGPDNPDVLSMRHQMEELEARLAEANTSSAMDNLKEDADNPAYLQFVSQLKSAEEQHRSLLQQRDALHEQQEKYQQALADTPESEKELAALSRDYDNAQLRYRDLKEKKMAADMDAQMVQDRTVQRLVVIDPPRLPRSTQPSRKLLIFGGFILALIGGLGGVVVAESMQRSVHGSRHLSELVGAAPLVTIPYIRTEQERENLARMRLRAIGSGFLIVIGAFYVLGWVHMPFDTMRDFISHHLLGMS